MGGGGFKPRHEDETYTRFSHITNTLQLIFEQRHPERLSRRAQQKEIPSGKNKPNIHRSLLSHPCIKSVFSGRCDAARQILFGKFGDESRGMQTHSRDFVAALQQLTMSLNWACERSVGAGSFISWFARTCSSPCVPPGAIFSPCGFVNLFVAKTRASFLYSDAISSQCHCLKS